MKCTIVLLLSLLGSLQAVDIVNASMSSSAPQCYCAPASLWSNERMPTDARGSGCVGGCGGKDYIHHQPGGMVQTLTVWWSDTNDDNAGIKAIRLKFFDDHEEYVVGKPGSAPGGQTPKTITFGPGETVSGDVVLSGNGYGTRLGYIKFATSAEQKFEVGQNGHDKYLFPSGNSFISGIVGSSGDDVDALAFIFWKPVRDVYYIDVSYPTLDTLSKLKSPTEIATHLYCNDNSVRRPFAAPSQEKDVTTGNDACFTGSSTLTFGQKISVKAGIPDLGEATAETSWGISATLSFSNCKKSSSTLKQTLKFPDVTLDPRTRTSYSYTQWQGSLSSLPFTATFKAEFDDGTTFTKSESGVYKGTSYTSIHESWSHEEKNVTDCSKMVPSGPVLLV